MRPSVCKYGEKKNWMETVIALYVAICAFCYAKIEQKEIL